MKQKNSNIQWDVLERISAGNKRPARMSEWQKLFSDIYPVSDTEGYSSSFIRLTEDLGELAEVVRVFRRHTGYLLSEIADVFAWLTHVQNLIKKYLGYGSHKLGEMLENSMGHSYPNRCIECGVEQCICPPILSTIIGRIANEVPDIRGYFNTKEGRFIAPENQAKYLLREN